MADLARVVGSNPEALRRIIKSMLDAGEKVPGVARIGRRYQIHIDAFIEAWARGDVWLREMLPPAPSARK